MSLARVRRANGLKEWYPHSPVVSYLRALEIKATFALGRKDESEKLWLSFLKDETKLINADRLLTLLRLGSFLSIDFHTVNFCWCAYWLAKQMGDELYMGLALAEIKLQAENELPPIFESELRELSSRYHRIFDFLNQINATEQIMADKKKMTIDACIASDPDLVFFKTWGICFSIKELKTKIQCDEHHMIYKILNAIAESNRAIPKEMFFKKIWGLEFSKDRHKTTLSMGLTRFYKQTGIKLSIKNGTVSIPSIWRID